MKIAWLPQAINDLQGIRAYIAQHDAKAARRVAQKIRQTVQHLKAHPQLGRPADVENIRLMGVPTLPYFIPYRVNNDYIEILQVFHTAQDRPENWEG
jgi:plasmid stabilization system protein ParE